MNPTPGLSWRRKWIFALVLALLVGRGMLGLVHMSWVRRAVLSYSQSRLSQDFGLLLDAGDLNYNLLSPSFEVRQVSVRFIGKTGLPPILKAERIYVRLRYWDLIAGSATADQIAIDGLTLQWVIDKQGQDNLPEPRSKSAANGFPTLPVRLLEITNLSLSFADESGHFSASLPKGVIHGQYRQGGEQRLQYLSRQAGTMRWNGEELPLVAVSLESILRPDSFEIQSLNLSAANSNIQAKGRLEKFDSPRLSFSAQSNLDCEQFAKWTRSEIQASGRVRTSINGSGTFDALKLNAAVASEGLSVAGLRASSVAAALDYDRQSNVLRIEELSAGIFSGMMRASGQIDTIQKETTSTLSIEFARANLRQVAQALGWNADVPAVIDGRLSLAWPGTEWERWQMKAVGQMRPKPGKTGGLGSPLNFVASAENKSGLVRIKADSISVPGATLQGNLDLRPNRSLQGDFRGSISSLALLQQNLENLIGHPDFLLPGVPIGGTAELTGSVTGSVKRPIVSVGFVASSLSAAGLTGANMQLQANYDPDRLEFESALLEWQGQRATASGSIDLRTAGTPLHLNARVDQVSIPTVANAYRVHSQIGGTASAQLTLSGSFSSPIAALTVATDGLAIDGELLGHLTSEVTLQNRKLRVDRLRVEKPQPSGNGVAEGHGTFDLDSHEYEVELDGKNLQSSSLLLPGGVTLAGTFDVKATGKGMLDNPTGQLRVQGRELQIAKYPVGDLLLGVQFVNHHAAVDLTAPSLQMSAQLGIEMREGYPIQFEFTDDHTPIRLSHHGNALGTGSFDAQVKGQGLLSKPDTLEASAKIQNLQLSLFGQEIRNSQPIEAAYTSERLNISSLALKSGKSTFQVNGSLPLRADLPADEIALKADLDLDAVGNLLPDMKFRKTQGTAELNGKIKGSLTDPEFSGLLSLRDGRLEMEAIPDPLTDLNAELEAESGLVSLKSFSGKLGDGTIQASGTWPLQFSLSGMNLGSESLGRPAQFSIRADKIPWSSLTAVPEKTSGYFSVGISGDASRLALNAVKARAEFGEILVRQDRYELSQAVPTILNLRGGQIQVEQLQWKGSGTELRIAGTAGLEPDYPLDLRISGDVDVRLVQLLVPTLQAAGPAHLDLNVGGSARGPALTGYLEASKTTIGLRSPRLLGENIDLRVDLNRDRILLSQLTGTLNGGSLRGSGGAAWRNRRFEDVNLEFTGHDVFLNFPTGFKTTSELALQLRSRGQSLELGGTIEVREGSYHEPFELGAMSQLSAQTVQTTGGNAGQSGWPEVFYNIQVRTKQPVDVDNNLARFFASANLKLAGTVRRPGLLGSVGLEPGGKLYFGDRSYLIEQGVVNFTSESRVDPVFDVFATTRVKEYEIGLRLTGTVRDSETTFTSDPPLSRDDIISVLLTGQTLSQSGGTGINPSQAGTFSLAAGAMNVNLSGKLRRRIGVSQVSIEPGLIAAESNPGARLTIGQDLTRNLRIVYSMNLTNSSDQIWIAEYDIRRRFMIRAVQQSSDTDRVEFRHDIRFGGSSKPLIGLRGAGAPKRQVGKVEFGGNFYFQNPPSPLPSPPERGRGEEKTRVDSLPSAGGEGARRAGEEEGPAPPSKGDSSLLAKKFKVKSGDKYDFVKVRKGVERLEKFYQQQDYLESRVRLQTSEQANTVDLSVHIEAGRKVKLTYEGTALPKSVRHRVRQEWQSSVSDVQRSEDSQQAIQTYLAKKGYLQAEVSSKTGEETQHEKTVLFHIDPGIHFKNVNVVYEGLDKDETKDLIHFLEGRNLKDSVYSESGRLAEAVARYLQQHGYLLAKVALPERQLDSETKTGRIVVPVTKGPEFTVAGLRFSGNSSLTDKELKSKLPITEGTVFDPSKIESALTALKDQYGRNGFRNAEVDFGLTRDDTENSVEIHFTIEEKLKSVIQSVKVEGEEKVSEKFIRKQIDFSEGEAQDVAETNRSIRRLYSTGTFARVEVESQPLPDLPTNTQGLEPVNVVVRVQETRPYKFVYGGYFDSDRGPGVIAESELRNVLGSSRLLGLRTRFDRDYQEGRFYVTQPPLKQLPLQSTITGYSNDETVRNVYDLKTLGFTFQQEGRFREKYLFSYGYRYEKKRAFVFDNPLFQNYHYAVAPLLGTLSRTSRDDYLDPTRGSFTSHAVEFAPEKLGSTLPYVRYFGQYFKYFPISSPQYVPFGGETKRPRFIYATGVRVGLMKQLTNYTLVPSERFFAGGGTTVRGFEQDKLGPLDRFGNPLGGNAMLVLNNELRFPFVSILDAVGFFDIGNVYPTISDFSFSDLRKTAGFGLRLRTPFLMIRIDYGFKLDRRPGESMGALFISIGQAF
jgi:outer membrane protein assembly complex protein YaeT